ncbi:MAG TPA: hypothetical protein VJZ91_00770, partial [Blastocatellia bacterium]|nr:hypothetical protein [Blastocatellia bacterium]
LIEPILLSIRGLFSWRAELVKGLFSRVLREPVTSEAPVFLLTLTAPRRLTYQLIRIIYLPALENRVTT